MNTEQYEAIIRHADFVIRYGSGLANRVLSLFDNDELKLLTLSNKKFKSKIEKLLNSEKRKADKLVNKELKAFARLEQNFIKQLSNDFKQLGFTNDEINSLIQTALDKPLVVNNMPVKQLYESTFERKELLSTTLNNLVANGLKDNALALVEFNAMLSQFANGMKASNTTFAFAVQNEIREEAYNKTNAVDRVVMSAVLDGRTTPYCMSIDGTIFNKGDGPRPPFHTRCRTIAVPLLFEETEDDVKEMLSLRSTVGPGKNYNKGDNTKLKAHKSLIEKGKVKLGVGDTIKESATSYGDFLAKQATTKYGKQFIIDKLGKTRGNWFINELKKGGNPQKLLKKALNDLDISDLDINGLKKKIKENKP